MFGLSPVVLGVVALVALVIISVLAVVSRYKVAKPNEALLITGRKSSGEDLAGQKVVIGAGVFVLPVVQKMSVMDLSSREIELRVPNAVSKNNIKLTVDGIAIVKVGGTDEAVRAAAQRFGNQQGAITAFTERTLSGALRSIVGTLTVEEIIRDRAALGAQVAEVTEHALTGQGLTLDNFQVLDINDDTDYLRNLGRPEAARVEQDAKIAEADATRNAEQRQLAAQQEVLVARRDFALREAQIKAETEAAQANAAAAGPLAAAAKQQEVLTAQSLVAERQAELTERQLDTEVRKPADAKRYAAQQDAEAARFTTEQNAAADKYSKVAQAQAQAETAKLTGQAERDRRAAIAAATKLEGEAEAAATLARGQAEARTMEAKADALGKYGEAAKMQMLVEVLPQVARELASPMAAIDKLTVVSTDGAGALPKTVTNNFAQLQAMLRDATGVDLNGLMDGIAGRNGSSAAAAGAAGAATGAVVAGALADGGTEA